MVFPLCKRIRIVWIEMPGSIQYAFDVSVFVLKTILQPFAISCRSVTKMDFLSKEICGVPAIFFQSSILLHPIYEVKRKRPRFNLLIMFYRFLSSFFLLLLHLLLRLFPLLFIAPCVFTHQINFHNKHFSQRELRFLSSSHWMIWRDVIV